MRLEDAIHHLAAAVDEVKSAAMRDDKTPLLNGLAFGRAMKEVGTQADPYVLVFGDLNGFKDINTKYTHAGGDAALETAGRAINAAVESLSAVAFRQSGDEFALLCPFEKIAEVESALQRTFQKLEVEFNEHRFEVRMSFGWTRIERTESSLVWKERAEIACDVAKQRGPGICVEWTPTLAANNKEERRRCVCGCSFRAEHESFTADTVLYCPRCGKPVTARIQASNGLTQTITR